MEAIQKLFPSGQTNSDRTVAEETRRQDGPTFEEALREGALDPEPATSPRSRDGATRAPEAPAVTRKETRKDVDVDAEDHPDGVQGLTTHAARVDAPVPGRSFGEGTAAAPSILQGEPVATARATPGAGSIPVDGALPGKTVAPETTTAHGAATTTTTTTTTHIPTKEAATQGSDPTSGSFSSSTPSGGINAAVAAAVGTAAAAAAVANRGADAVTLAADPSAPDKGSPAEGTASVAPTPASRPDHSAGGETSEDGKRGSSSDQGRPVLEATTPPPDFAKVQTTAGDGNVTSTLAATGTSAPQSATGVRPGATALPPVIEPSTGQVSLERILDQVKIRLAPQRPEVTIVIDPPELGRLHLRLSMHKGALSATVTADDPRVTRAFEADLGRLVRTLDEAGIRVGSVEIRTELSQSHDQGRGGRNDTHQASQEDQHRDARSLNKAVRTAVAPPPSVAGMSRTIAKTRSTLDLVV